MSVFGQNPPPAGGPPPLHPSQSEFARRHREVYPQVQEKKHNFTIQFLIYLFFLMHVLSISSFDFSCIVFPYIPLAQTKAKGLTLTSTFGVVFSKKGGVRTPKKGGVGGLLINDFVGVLLTSRENLHTLGSENRSNSRNPSDPPKMGFFDHF